MKPTGDTPASPNNGPAVAVPTAIEALVKEIQDTLKTKELEYPMAQEEKFDADLVVIGGGPGGYVASIRAAQLGAKVICVEKQYLGGTCLNWGCIPSKAMIAGVDALNHVKHAGEFGVTVEGNVSLDFEKYSARRNKIVTTLRGGVGSLLKKNKVEHVEGYATFVSPHEVEVEKDGERRRIKARNFIVGTGSTVIMPPIPGMVGGREEGLWTSDDAVTAPHIPGKIMIIGGGVIGVEFGYVFNGLGSQVTIVEMMPQLLPMMDEELGKELAKSFSRHGITIMAGNAVEKMAKTDSGWKVTVTGGGKSEEVEVDVVLVAVGRRSFTDNLGIEKIGVKANRQGIEVDEFLRTSVPHIYAIGDVTGRIQLAHVASYEGSIAAENAVKGANKRPDYRAVPNCIYTVPEVASVGMSEGEARESGKEVIVGKFHFRGLGKAMAAGAQDGFVKVVAEKQYGEILGVHMVGAHVTDLIGQAVLAIKLEATVDVLVDTIHAHPTMTEALLEAYEDTHGMAIHK